MAEAKKVRIYIDPLGLVLVGIAAGFVYGLLMVALDPWLRFPDVPIRINWREALLTALRAMPPRTRANLAVLSQRTPPQERDELRTQLLAVPQAQRDAWLRERLAE